MDLFLEINFKGRKILARRNILAAGKLKSDSTKSNIETKTTKISKTFQPSLK